MSQKADTVKNTNTIKLLHIEDNASDIQLFEYMLAQNKSAEYNITACSSLQDALNMLTSKHFDIALLDLNLSDSSGTSTIELLRKDHPNLPIIVLTDSHDDTTVQQIIRCGAQDYIHKNDFDNQVISRIIRYSIDRKHAENKLEYLAQYDALTGLVNRAVLVDRLDRSMIRNHRYSCQVVVMMLDLDNFKNINDTLGHDIGDRLLIKVAKRLKSCIRKVDTVSRLGGDEFTFLFENSQDDNCNIQTIAGKILQSLSQPFNIDGNTVFTSGSIGIATASEFGNKIDGTELLKNADMAMYRSKKSGGNRHSFFTKDLQISAQIRTNIEANLREALHKKQLFLMYQPQIDIETKTICGIEALIRWQHPQHGVLEPSDFLSILEETGLIVLATEWVIEEALSQWKQWREANVISKETSIAINLSPKLMRHPRIHEKLNTTVKQLNIPTGLIDLEFTENIFIDSTTQNINLFKNLKKSGFTLSIDDFGTGYSSLRYLKNFDIDCIKLDRSFIKDILTSKKDAAITSVIVDLGKKLDINVIAEGVDDEKKLALLKSFGCRIIQGFLFSKPLTSENLGEFSREKHYLKSIK